LPLSFPCAAYELRHSSDLALLTKWPVFLQNAFGNPAYVNQKILKLGKILGGRQTGGHCPHRPPLESPLALRDNTPALCWSKLLAHRGQRLKINNRKFLFGYIRLKILESTGANMQMDLVEYGPNVPGNFQNVKTSDQNP